MIIRFATILNDAHAYICANQVVVQSKRLALLPPTSTLEQLYVALPYFDGGLNQRRQTIVRKIHMKIMTYETEKLLTLMFEQRPSGEQASEATTDPSPPDDVPVTLYTNTMTYVHY
jgi:hypothetical protein